MVFSFLPPALTISLSPPSMPYRTPGHAPVRKRKRQKDDPLASDSSDENFSDAPSPRHARKSKPIAKGRKKAPGGRKRGDQYESDEEDISIDEEEDYLEQEDEVVEMGPSGRPLRSARKSKTANYVEDDTDEVEQDDDDEDNEDEDRQGRKSKSSKKGIKTEAPSKRKLVIKLRVGKAQVGSGHVDPPNPPARRSARAASANAITRPTTGGKVPIKTAGTRGGSVGPPLIGTGLMTRRSSRLGHIDEPLAQLTTSGKHAEIIMGGHEEAIMEEGESSLEITKTHASSNGSYKKEEEEPSAEIDGGHDEILNENARDDLDHDVPMEIVEEIPATDAIEADEDMDAPGEEESVQGDLDAGHEADEDEDDLPSKRTRTRSIGGGTRRESTASPRTTRSAADKERALSLSADKLKESPSKRANRLGRLRKSTRGDSRKAGGESDGDEYREDEDEGSGEEMSSDGGSPSKPPRSAQTFVVDDEDEDYSEVNTSRRGRSQGKRPAAGSQLRSSKRRLDSSDHEQVSQAEQLEAAEELEDLRPSPKRRRPLRGSGPSGNEEVPDRTLRRRAQPVDYRILRPENKTLFDEPEGGASTPSRRRAGTVSQPGKSLFDTFGPFGGGGGPIPLFGRPGKFSNMPQDIDSDSSDDDRMQKPSGVGGVSGMAGIGGGMGMTPGLLPSVAQTHNNMDPLQGTPANLGKVTKPAKQTLADADPLGVATDITFDSVGGLDDKIHLLKEMVQLPLSYPEIFAAKNMTPPRGVLFYGPPGTGKTLMARALAASCSSESRKVTFYMRKGADCLSKWVGEAERQLRLLFEEAKNNQPSIIFFDEIDGIIPLSTFRGVISNHFLYRSCTCSF